MGEPHSTFMGFVLVVLTLCSCGRDADRVSEIGDPLARLSVENARVVQPPTGVDRAVAYMRIDNRGSVEVALEGAAADVAEAVELHEMSFTDGMMRMRRIDRVAIGGGASLELRQGSVHLMLIGLRQPLEIGEILPITLRLDAGDLQVMVPVRPQENEPNG